MDYGNPGDITDPEIGELKFYYKYWLQGDIITFHELKTKVCEQLDFNNNPNKITIEKSAFFPI